MTNQVNLLAQEIEQLSVINASHLMSYACFVIPEFHLKCHISKSIFHTISNYYHQQEHWLFLHGHLKCENQEIVLVVEHFKLLSKENYHSV